jgi:hypothetical protein
MIFTPAIPFQPLAGRGSERLLGRLCSDIFLLLPVSLFIRRTFFHEPKYDLPQSVAAYRP